MKDEAPSEVPAPRPKAKHRAPRVPAACRQVLDSSGSGSYSNIISGLGWCVTHHRV